MEITEAIETDFPELRSFYDRMCDFLGEQTFLPDGNKGGFPPDAMIKAAIADGNLFAGREDDIIVAAYIMSHDCDTAYDKVQWNVQADKAQVVILHALRVLPEYGGRGYSRQLVTHAIDTAKKHGMKAIRLDCIVGDDIPQKMYQSFGFRLVDTVSITYVDIGVPRDFNLYELELSKCECQAL